MTKHIYQEKYTMCVNFNIDDVPIVSLSHTHPSHSQTSLLLSTSLSLGTSPLPPIHLLCVRFLYPPVLSFRLSYHRHPYLSIPLRSHFIQTVHNCPKNNLMFHLRHPPPLSLCLSPHRYPLYIFPTSSRFLHYHKKNTS